MAKAKIYTVYDNGERIGAWTPQVANLVLGISDGELMSCARSEIWYKGRYHFVSEDDKSDTGMIKKKLADDWDFTTRMFLTVGGRKAHGTGQKCS